MAWTDIERCWRTTDGKVFIDPDEAEEHQDEIDREKFLKDFRIKMAESIEEAMKPVKEAMAKACNQEK